MKKMLTTVSTFLLQSSAARICTPVSDSGILQARFVITHNPQCCGASVMGSHVFSVQVREPTFIKLFLERKS